MPSEFAVREPNGDVYPKTRQSEEWYRWGLDKFRKEAETLMRFNHPSIVRVLQYFEGHGTAYMVMEYLEGQTLFALLHEQKTLSEARLRALLVPILDGLEQVHAAEYLHPRHQAGKHRVQGQGHAGADRLRGGVCPDGRTQSHRGGVRDAGLLSDRAVQRNRTKLRSVDGSLCGGCGAVSGNDGARAGRCAFSNRAGRARTGRPSGETKVRQATDRCGGLGVEAAGCGSTPVHRPMAPRAGRAVSSSRACRRSHRPHLGEAAGHDRLGRDTGGCGWCVVGNRADWTRIPHRPVARSCRRDTRRQSHRPGR